MLSLKAPGGDPYSFSICGDCGQVLGFIGLWKHNSNVCLSVCLSLYKFPFFYKDNNHIGFKTLSNLI